MRILLYCGALAAGEFAVASVPNFTAMWPMAAIAAALVASFGYGLAVRGWPYVALFLAGVALFLHASGASERVYRELPWLRGRRMRVQRQTGATARVREDLSRRLAIGLEQEREVVALNRAILLGERAKLPYRIKRTFVESGTMHVFAISGLHVMAVAQVLIISLSLLFVSRRFVGAMVIPLLWGYVHLIGWSPSAVRAAMMATFYYVAPVFWRKPDGVRSWALTFLVVHVVNPRMIVNVGCALSFTVMLAIILAGRLAEGMRGWKSALWMTFAAWAAGVPISAHVFGRVTPGGLLANLVLIAAAKFTVVSGVIGMGASFVSGKLAAHVNNFCALFTKAMVMASEFVASLPGSNFDVGRWSLLQCAGWYALMLLGLTCARRLGGRGLVVSIPRWTGLRQAARWILRSKAKRMAA